MATPLRQGQLDGLCGVYAVINAFTFVCPALVDHRESLFSEIIRGLCKKKILAKSILERTVIDHVVSFINLGGRFAKTHLDIDVGYARPFRHDYDFGNVRSYRQYLQDHLAVDTVALVGLEGKADHWSIIRRHGSDLCFHDSDCLRKRDIKMLTLGDNKRKYKVNVAEAIIIGTNFKRPAIIDGRQTHNVRLRFARNAA